MIFVDSSVWIDWLRGRPTPQADVLDRLVASQRVLMGDLVLVEVLQGIADPDEFRHTRSVLLGLEQVDVVGVEIALLAADYYRRLRALGITVRKTIDTLIATRCIHEGWPLLYSDRDFDPFVEHLGLHSAAVTG